MQGILSIRHRLIALLLTIIFIGYVGNNTFCMHSRQVDNKVIVHANPFGEPTHSHNTASLITISAVNHFIITAATILSIAAISMYLISIFRNQIFAKLKKNTTQYISLRAPPVAIA